MATGFFLKDAHAARTNIYIIVRIAGQRYKKSTGIMIDPKYWNSVSQTIRDTKELPSAKVFIGRLKEWRQAADAVCDRIMAGADIPLPDEFWARVAELMDGSRNIHIVTISGITVLSGFPSKKPSSRNILKEFLKR